MQTQHKRHYEKQKVCDFTSPFSAPQLKAGPWNLGRLGRLGHLQGGADSSGNHGGAGSSGPA